MTTTPRVWKSQTQVNTADSGAQTDGQIAATQDGGYVVVWHSINFTIGQRYDSAGNKLSGEVITSFSGGEQPAVTVLANGNIAVAVADLSTPSIYVNIFSPTWGSPLRTDFIDGGTDLSSPSITAFADGSYVISYTDGAGLDNSNNIVARVVSANGAVGTESGLEGASDNDDQDGSELATLSNGNFVAVYEDEFLGSATDHDIKYGIFTKTGAPVTFGQPVPGGADSGLERDPDVAALRDGFVVVWTDPSSSVTDIRATILSNTGTTVASNILVNTNTTAAQNEASVVALADGGFVVTWENDLTNLVRAQRFDAAGSKIGAEFTVKNGVSDGFFGDSPEAALLSDGRFAFALGNVVVADHDVMTSIFTVDTRNDFNANGISDILWQGSDGTPALWLMNGLNTVSFGAVGPLNPGPSWHVKHGGDFNGDGRSDILWQGSDGTPAIWLMDGMNTVSFGAVGPFNPGPSWQVKSSGDFNGDGKDDILWQGSDGTPAIWLMDGMNTVSFGAVGPLNPGPSWQIKGTGDFNGDGRSDILWQGSDGTPAIWLMNGMNTVSFGVAGSFNPGPDWQIKGTGDFNGDGRSDILWQGSDGTPAIWLMDGMNTVSFGAVGPFNPGPSWQVKGTSDFNGDGNSDILWQSDDGAPAIWLMNGMNFLSGAAAGSFNPGSDWDIIA